MQIGLLLFEHDQFSVRDFDLAAFLTSATVSFETWLHQTNFSKIADRVHRYFPSMCIAT